MHTKKEEERKEKGKIRGNGDTLENHKGNVRKTREREREREVKRERNRFFERWSRSIWPAFRES